MCRHEPRSLYVISLPGGTDSHLVALISWPLFTPNRVPNYLSTIMDSQRPQRVRKSKVIWEAIEDTTRCSRKKAIQKAPRTTKKEALIPILVESIPLSIPRELPSYTPAIKIRQKRKRPKFKGLSELQIFKRFFTEMIIQLIMVAINSCAVRHQNDLDLPYIRT